MVGRREIAVIDPGPDVEEHVRALESRVASAERARILLTHGHGDHAGAAAALSEATGAPVCGPAGMERIGLDRILEDGAAVPTDAGELRALHTPGHTPEHLCYHWPASRALFAGDLVLGEGDTTWVAEYPGCVADYLDSMARVRGLDLEVIYPAHGPALHDPADTWARFEGHRRSRIAQLREAIDATPHATPEELLDAVYGSSLPAGLRAPALKSLRALVDYVNGVRAAPSGG